jgi:hypothetical protein
VTLGMSISRAWRLLPRKSFQKRLLHRRLGVFLRPAPLDPLLPNSRLQSGHCGRHLQSPHLYSLSNYGVPTNGQSLGFNVQERPKVASVSASGAGVNPLFGGDFEGLGDCYQPVTVTTKGLCKAGLACKGDWAWGPTPRSLTIKLITKNQTDK